MPTVAAKAIEEVTVAVAVATMSEKAVTIIVWPVAAVAAAAALAALHKKSVPVAAAAAVAAAVQLVAPVGLATVISVQEHTVATQVLMVMAPLPFPLAMVATLRQLVTDMLTITAQE